MAKGWRRDDFGMSDPALDDALVTATDRTRAAQEKVAAQIDAEQVVEPGLVDDVVQRAEELEDLAQESAQGA